MIDRRNRQFMHRSKSMYLPMPIRRLGPNSATTDGQTGGLTRRSPLVVEPRMDDESLEQRQRVIVWCLMALLWALFLMAGIILWQRAAWGS
jgi:hypothetical protein